MSVHYNNDFKKEVVKEYKSGAKTIAEIAAEFNIAKSTVSEWAKKYSEECQYTTSNKSNVESESAKEIRRLNQLLKDKDKEIDFLKKAAAFFAKEID